MFLKYLGVDCICDGNQHYVSMQAINVINMLETEKVRSINLCSLPLLQCILQCKQNWCITKMQTNTTMLSLHPQFLYVCNNAKYYIFSGVNSPSQSQTICSCMSTYVVDTWIKSEPDTL